jgi:hypothetical protein
VVWVGGEVREDSTSTMARSGWRERDCDGQTTEGDSQANPRLLQRAIHIAVRVNPAFYGWHRLQGEGGGALGLSSGSGRGCSCRTP